MGPSCFDITCLCNEVLPTAYVTKRRMRCDCEYELKRVWKVEVVASVKILPRNLIGVTEKSCKKPRRTGWSVSAGDSITRPSECEAGVPTTRLQYYVS